MASPFFNRGKIILGAALAAILWVGCSFGSQEGRVKLRFITPQGVESDAFSMEVMATDAERKQGLMFRRSVPPRQGMIFLFPEAKDHSFWMKNTFIPLDMVFVGSDWRVVGVLENVPPLTLDSRSVGAPSQYVLEFAGGTMKSIGVTAGTQVRIEGTLPLIQ